MKFLTELAWQINHRLFFKWCDSDPYATCKSGIQKADYRSWKWWHDVILTRMDKNVCRLDEMLERLLNE